jgi:hypothetical protein
VRAMAAGRQGPKTDLFVSMDVSLAQRRSWQPTPVLTGRGGMCKFGWAGVPKVLKIKNKYDPKDVFWAKASTGSEGWAVRGDLKLRKV